MQKILDFTSCLSYNSVWQSIAPLAPVAVETIRTCDHHDRIHLPTFQGGSTLKTFIPKAADIDRKWYVVDADGMVLGRLASQVANILRGKNKPIYTPNMDTGDYVIIINAGKAVLTGKKLDQKIYYHHSGYAGGLKETKYRKLMAEKPEFAVRRAVVGMLPKGPLGRQMARKLKVYAGAEHEQAAQKPEVLELK